MELGYDPVEQLRRNGAGLLARAREAAPGTRIPSCPDWSMADLVAHVWDVWATWGGIVRQGLVDLAEVEAFAAGLAPPDARQADAAAAALEALARALEGAGPDRRVWTWTGSDQPASWVRRRMAHEAAVHRWDAEAALGRSWSVDAVVAADGVDEFLTWFAGARPSDGPAEVAIELACTDVGERWLVHRLAHGDVAFERGASGGDAVLAAPASDLLLWLWRRDAGPVRVEGDAALAARLRGGTALD